MFVQLENIQFKDWSPWLKPNPPGWVHTLKTLNNNNWCFRITFCYFPESSKIKLKKTKKKKCKPTCIWTLKHLWIKVAAPLSGEGRGIWRRTHYYTFGRKKFNKWQHGMCSGPHIPKKRWSMVKHDGTLRSTKNSLHAATEAEYAKTVCAYFVRAAAAVNVLEAGWKNWSFGTWAELLQQQWVF